MNDLKKYNEKRNFKKTNEPVGKSKKSNKKLIFCVQHHLARKDHYDLRLEWKGVLVSFAVPKGPSYNIKDKRLAIKVENHPKDYHDFEGTIPKGEYGGGTVMLWDEGYWEPLENVDFNKPMKFILYGKRLKGKWTLIPFKSNNYFLRKEKDYYKGYKDIKKINKSIKTGLKMEDIENSNIENVTISSPHKLIYPKDKITKLDVIKYYQKVYERMYPFLETRLISTIRCPEGIEEKCFFKKHLETDNDGIGKKTIKNNDNHKEDYYYIKNINGLISEVQMNSIEFHIWGSKVNDLNKPDMMVFDLDPDEKLSLNRLREGVKDLKSVLDEFSLKSYLKTSGGKGYHVIVPIKINNWKEFRLIAKNIVILMETKCPNKYTANMRKEKRKGKIFIDWVRNTKGSTSVAPYSLRARKGAPVSLPISWKELDKITPNQIKLKDAIKFLKKKNPWIDFFD